MSCPAKDDKGSLQTFTLYFIRHFPPFYSENLDSTVSHLSLHFLGVGGKVHLRRWTACLVQASRISRQKHFIFFPPPLDLKKKGGEPLVVWERFAAISYLNGSRAVCDVFTE